MTRSAPHLALHESIVANDPPAIEWRGVSLDLGEFAVRDLSLRLEKSEWLGICGPTGAGKTLVLEVAAGFRAPTSGVVLRDGKDITKSTAERRRIAYVPQEGLLFPHLDVRQNILFAVMRKRRKSISALYEQVILELGIAHLTHRNIQSISGGEAQRIALGRGLLADADVLLLDESTSALDEETKQAVGMFLQRWRKEHRLTIVQVSHDIAELSRLADRIASMSAGRLVDANVRRASLAANAG
jgi:ABC-type Fe3+/spermidine/putrescine transport system ATPase subunit